MLKGLILAAALSAASVPDMPHKGDQFTVVYSDKDVVVGVNTHSIRDETDGSKSAVVLLVYSAAKQEKVNDALVVASSGRIAFNCHKSEERILTSYFLGREVQVIAEDTKNEEKTFSHIEHDTVLELVSKVVCNISNPAVTRT